MKSEKEYHEDLKSITKELYEELSEDELKQLSGGDDNWTITVCTASGEGADVPPDDGCVGRGVPIF